MDPVFFPYSGHKTNQLQIDFLYRYQRVIFRNNNEKKATLAQKWAINQWNTKLSTMVNLNM